MQSDSVELCCILDKFTCRAYFYLLVEMEMVMRMKS